MPITAIGTANPPYKRSQKEAAELLAAAFDLNSAEKRLLRVVYKATGIDARHSVLPDYCGEPGHFTFFPNDPDDPYPSTSARMAIYKDNALPLALAAIDACFSSLPSFDKNNITHLITVSCTGMYAPGIDIEIIQRLGFPSTTQRTAINFMGCYGAFNALKAAHAISQSEKNANIMIVCVEICTIHVQKNMSMDHIVSNAIFADGAAAVIVQSQPDEKKHLSIDAFHSDLLAQSDKEMAWHIGDQGFDIVLSSYVPQLIQSGIAAFMQTLLNKRQLSPSDIDFYAIHPGGIKILQACEKTLTISKQQNKYAYEVLRQYGNMSSATIFFVLKRIFDEIQAADHQKNIFSCAFGPGLTLESALLKVNYL
jgi:alpha-pyrone synthase